MNSEDSLGRRYSIATMLMPANTPHRTGEPFGKTVTQPSEPPRDAVHQDEHHHQSCGQVLHFWKDLARRCNVKLSMEEEESCDGLHEHLGVFNTENQPRQEDQNLRDEPPSDHQRHPQSFAFEGFLNKRPSHQQAMSNQNQTVHHAPEDEIPRGTVPQAAKGHGGHQRDVQPALPFAASTQ